MDPTNKIKKTKRKKRKSPLEGLKITKPLLWLEKYLLRAKRIMPALKLPKKILSYRPRLNQKHRNWGSCSITDRIITMATHKHGTVVRKGAAEDAIVPVGHREILMTLAHELAHLEYPEHGYEQKWYALTIFNTFGITDACPTCRGKGVVPARYENE